MLAPYRCRRPRTSPDAGTQKGHLHRPMLAASCPRPDRWQEASARRNETMAENSKIGWTHHSWNPWWGCDKVTLECKHCYIDAIMRKAGKAPFKGPMRTKDWS